MRSHPPGSAAPGPCPYELDDGAYILGALAPAERTEFERHLAGCRTCRDSMAQLAVLPGLLGRLNPDKAQPPVAAPPSLLPRVLAIVRAERVAQRRRRVLATVASVVAAMALAGAVGIGLALRDAGPATTQIAYRPMTVSEARVQIDAQIGILEQQTGTLVGVRCRYPGTDDRTWKVLLIVYPRNEEGEPIGSWIATAGELVEVTAITHHAPNQIARIELQTPDHTTIAWWTP